MLLCLCAVEVQLCKHININTYLYDSGIRKGNKSAQQYEEQRKLRRRASVIKRKEKKRAAKRMSQDIQLVFFFFFFLCLKHFGIEIFDSYLMHIE